MKRALKIIGIIIVVLIVIVIAIPFFIDAARYAENWKEANRNSEAKTTAGLRKAGY